jgi:flagellar biosynthesis/type III secretory pathway ATPase
VEGDDMNEPISDAVRSILDGHIVLSRTLAARNHYPCIDVLHSTSRLFPELATKDQREAAARFRELLAAYTGSEDLIKIGAYQKGSSRLVDEAIDRHDHFTDYLKQDRTERVDLGLATEQLLKVGAN